MKLSRLWNLKLSYRFKLCEIKNRSIIDMYLPWKNVTIEIIVVQQNSHVGSLCKVFVNSVLIGWWTIIFQIINKHEPWLDQEQ